MSSTRQVFICSVALVFILCGCQGGHQSHQVSSPSELSEAELITLGQQIYREGTLSNGEPVEAVVLGDVPVAGTQFTCLDCHRRSGWGSSEVTKSTLPTSAGALYSPRVRIYRERPAYTDETLEEVILTGFDSAGNPLDLAMPWYHLPDKEMTALIAYLKTLSKENSPGLTPEVIHLATVVGADVDPVTKKAMLDVLDTFFQNKNSQTRGEVKRVTHKSYYYHPYKNESYRKWVLHRWELQGPPDSWRAQLEEHYRRQPVFALISGIVQGEWVPIHGFCEDNKIPYVLPNTDQPAINGRGDFYTLYFSKGLALEAQTILKHLSRTKTEGRIVQIFREGSGGAFAARALRKALSKYPQFSVEDRSLVQGQPIAESTLPQLEKGSTIASVLWLSEEDVAAFMGQEFKREAPGPFYLSPSLSRKAMASLSGSQKRAAFLAHPFFLPEVREDGFRRAEIWLKSRNIEITAPRIQGQTLFACMVLGEGLMHIKQNFHRDYLLDVLDHGEGMTAYANSYPSLSFGPEQRYLGKGAYIIDLSATTPKTTWIVH